MNAPVVALAPISAPLNRYSGLFADAVARTGAITREYRWGLRDLAATDAVIFHWPHYFTDPSSLSQSLAHLARLRMMQAARGLKLIWVAHNVGQHDATSRYPFIWRAFVSMLDGIIYLSDSSRALVRERNRVSGRTVELVTTHGVYPGDPTPFVPPAADRPVELVSVGLVRPYKNLEELVTAAQDIDPARTRVTIRGKRHDIDYATMLESLARPGGAVGFDMSDRLLDDAEIETAIDTAHGVVLPYRNILNSGSAIHALSRHRPVLVPALGSLPELADQVGRDWVHLYEGELTAKVVRTFADHIRSLPPGTAPDLSALGWDRVSGDLTEFLAEVVAR